MADEGSAEGSAAQVPLTSHRPRFCARCRAEIPAARLEAMPETEVCIQCSREIGGEFKVVAVPENVAKAGSIKRNYGSYTTRMVRRPFKRER